MNWLRKTNISQRIKLILLLTTFIALTLSTGGFLINEWINIRNAMFEQLNAQANIIGSNSVAAMAFNDPGSADKTLNMLKNVEDINAAILFDMKGMQFSGYYKDRTSMTIELPKQDFGFINDNAFVVRPVEMDDSRFGSILVISDNKVWKRHQQENLIIYISVLLFSFSIAFLFSNRLQHLISRPILQLAQMAQRITDQQDYNLRAEKTTYDEIGQLVDNFNVMLQQIQIRDQELKKANNYLAIEKEKAEQANLSKSRFLANMSHELRTPMHAILSFSNLGLKHAEQEKVRNHLNKIRISGERLTKLLDELLDLSKLESGKMEPIFAQYNLKNITQACLSEVDSLIANKELDINFDMVEELNVFLDKKLITQVIINLLSNAIKFSPEESLVVIEIHPDVLESEDAVLFSISDEGIGIPGDELKDIFDSFIQSSKTYSGSGGTGLGLAISKEIITLHRGKIWAESPPEGKSSGTVFKFIIPLSQPEDFV